jgi:ribosomal protein L10
VVKNTLANIAAKGTPAEGLAKALDGSTAIAYNSFRSGGAGESADGYARQTRFLYSKREWSRLAS